METYFVLLSEDGLYYRELGSRGFILLTPFVRFARVWESKEEASKFNTEILKSKLSLGEARVTVERAS